MKKVDRILNSFEETADYIATLFETDTGKVVLEALVKKYKDRKIADPTLSHEMAYYRQGQADVVRWIEQQINKSKVKE